MRWHYHLPIWAILLLSFVLPSSHHSAKNVLESINKQRQFFQNAGSLINQFGLALKQRPSISGALSQIPGTTLDAIGDLLFMTVMGLPLMGIMALSGIVLLPFFGVNIGAIMLGSMADSSGSSMSASTVSTAATANTGMKNKLDKNKNKVTAMKSRRFDEGPYEGHYQVETNAAQLMVTLEKALKSAGVYSQECKYKVVCEARCKLRTHQPLGKLGTKIIETLRKRKRMEASEEVPVSRYLFSQFLFASRKGRDCYQQSDCAVAYPTCLITLDNFGFFSQRRKNIHEFLDVLASESIQRPRQCKEEELREQLQISPHKEARYMKNVVDISREIDKLKRYLHVPRPIARYEFNDRQHLSPLPIFHYPPYRHIRHPHHKRIDAEQEDQWIESSENQVEDEIEPALEEEEKPEEEYEEESQEDEFDELELKSVDLEPVPELEVAKDHPKKTEEPLVETSVDLKHGQQSEGRVTKPKKPFLVQDSPRVEPKAPKSVQDTRGNQSQPTGQNVTKDLSTSKDPGRFEFGERLRTPDPPYYLSQDLPTKASELSEDNMDKYSYFLSQDSSKRPDTPKMEATREEAEDLSLEEFTENKKIRELNEGSNMISENHLFIDSDF